MLLAHLSPTKNPTACFLGAAQYHSHLNHCPQSSFVLVMGTGQPPQALLEEGTRASSVPKRIVESLELEGP